MPANDRAALAGGAGVERTPAEPGRIGRIVLAIRRHGLPRAVYDLALKTINTVVVFKILRGVVIERADPEFLGCPPRYTPLFLDAKMLGLFAADPGSGMTAAFVEEALSKGDECYGFLEDGRLVAYGWYASSPTRIDPPDLRVRFSDDYVYMYKGFTHPRARGQRLHAIGMTLALREYLARGRRGLVSYVESSNFDSLRSCGRMGYETFGSVYLMKVFGRYVTFASPGCRRLGFRLETAPRPGVS